MSLAVVEQIAVKIKAALDSLVQVAHPELWKACDRPQEFDDNYAFEHLKPVLVQGDPRPDPDASEVTLRVAWVQRFRVIVPIRPAKGTTTPIDTLVNLYVAQAVAALMADRTWSGLAQNTYLAGTPLLPMNSKCDGRSIDLEVRYRHRTADMTAK